jgi:subtilisin family serine protease
MPDGGNHHGTHVAGAIGAKNNGRGVTGVAPDTAVYELVGAELVTWRVGPTPPKYLDSDQVDAAGFGGGVGGFDSSHLLAIRHLTTSYVLRASTGSGVSG